jgi:tetratricopeptide (TPR) repeat protein
VRALGDAQASAAAQPGDVNRLLAQAAAAFAQRPDAMAVTRSRQIYLAAAAADETRVEGLLGASLTGAWLVEHEADGARRAELATEGVQACQWCAIRAPERIDCDYRLALALGQQARERPATAADALPRITALLARVVAVAPNLDEAGGLRVLALVHLRAPGWPAGPGDPESGLARAREAVRLSPAYPPNLLVLAEALGTNGDPDEALRIYEEAGQLARDRLAAGDPDASEWLQQASRASAALR